MTDPAPASAPGPAADPSPPSRPSSAPGRGHGGVVRAAGCVLWRRVPPPQIRTAEGAEVGPIEVEGVEVEGVEVEGVTAGSGPREADAVEIALVHRPRYDDWSHPKGKLERGESPAEAAVREVLEETGLHCRLGAPLPGTRYRVGGRPKEVSYWAAEAVGGRFEPNDEVDRLLWLPPAAARERLSHPHDRSLIDAALSTLRTV